MSIRHAAGAVFKAFAAHVTVFFVRMADFAPAVLRVTRNVMAVMMFMSAATAFFVFMVMFPTPTDFAMLMFVVVLMPALGTVFMVMVATAASPIFMMMVMRTHFITTVSYIR